MARSRNLLDIQVIGDDSVHLKQQNDHFLAHLDRIVMAEAIEPAIDEAEAIIRQNAPRKSGFMLTTLQRKSGRSKRAIWMATRFNYRKFKEKYYYVAPQEYGSGKRGIEGKFFIRAARRRIAVLFPQLMIKAVTKAIGTYEPDQAIEAPRDAA